MVLDMEFSKISESFLGYLHLVHLVGRTKSEMLFSRSLPRHVKSEMLDFTCSPCDGLLYFTMGWMNFTGEVCTSPVKATVTLTVKTIHIHRPLVLIARLRKVACEYELFQ